MKYVVLYTKRIDTASEQKSRWDGKEYTLFSKESVATYDTFDDEKEAAEFAVSKDGVVIMPAQVTLKIKEAKQTK